MIFTRKKSSAKDTPKHPHLQPIKDYRAALRQEVYEGYTRQRPSTHGSGKLDRKYRRLIDHSEPASLDQGK